MTKTIHLGVTDLSFHRVTAALVTQVLTSLGFDVKRSYRPHQDNFAKLKAGEIDMLNSAWLPSSHGVYKTDVEQAVPLIELGLHYEPYALWGVPDYVPESDVNAVTDLLKPDVLNKMKMAIQGINPGAGISRFSQQMLIDYGLDKAGYQFFTGTEEDCFGTFERNVAQQEWFVVPLWQPQFLHHKYNIRELQDPKGLLGVVDRAVLLLRDDRAAMFTREQLDILDSLKFGNKVIAELDYQVCREGLNCDEAAKTWLTKHFY